jgi:serine/threonine-protein kinase
MIGLRVGNYEIVDEIGRGGMATVYRAYQPRMDRFVAVKVIHRSIVGDTRALERFQREAQLIARLEHPHLLPVFDFDGLHEPPYIVMRYLEGGTLREVLDEARLPLGEVVYMLRQIASALDYAHRQGVIHRDIKPSNIMVDQDGNAFLMDFGIARMNEGGTGLTQTGFAVGTPGYMAPEQGMGMTTVDHRADLYSLGVMLFQMLTGEMPYGGETPMAVILKHMRDPIPRASELNTALPPEIDDVIARAMAKQPEDRYDTAGDLADDLTRIAGRTSGAVRPLILRQTAQRIAESIRQERRQRQDEIDRTMADFAASRAVPTRGVVEIPGGSSITPTDPHSVQSDATGMPPVVPVKRGGGATWIAAVVVVVLLGAIGFVLLSRGGGGAGDEPTAVVAVITEEATALVAPPPTDTDAPTATPESSATDTPQPTDTDVLTDTSEPTDTDTAEPTDTDALTETETIRASETEPETPIERPTEQPTETEAAAVAVVATSTERASATTAPTLTDLPTQTPEPTATDTEQPTLTATPTSTDTPTVTNTPEPTETPRPSATPTPSIPLVEAARDLPLWGGPGTRFEPRGTMARGEQFEIIGISEDLGWFQVITGDGSLAWVVSSAAFVNIYGDAAGLPIVPAPTSTPTDTATPSRTPTPTRTPTATATATATYTPSSTPTASPTATPTDTDTPTPTDTPTATPTPTASATPSETPTATPTLTATPTATITASPTQPLPTETPAQVALAVDGVGAFPYVADFEADAPLQNWSLDPNAWQVFDEAGENFLIGQATLAQPVRILGEAAPAWLGTTDLAISYRFNLAAGAPGARVLFRHSGAGYNVLEVVPGRMTLRRNGETPDLFAPAGERVLAEVEAPIAAGTWHEVIIWAESSQLFVYLDEKLTLVAEDFTPPQLPPGEILLQLLGATAPVRFDDFIIQLAETASGHFESATIPPTWVTNSTSTASIGQEAETGNQYLLLQGENIITPQVRPIGNLNLKYRHNVIQGDYRLFIRTTTDQSILLDMTGGVLTVSRVDASGNALFTYGRAQFFNRQRWEEVTIQFIDNRLIVARDGEVRYEGIIDDAPAAGGIEFRSRSNTIMWLDDVLITESAVSTNLEARDALALITCIQGRLIRERRSEFTEDFADPLGTAGLWGDGRAAPGEYINDPSVQEHQRYLRMQTADAAVARQLFDTIGVEMFRSGQDTLNFSNSTDLLVTVEVRFPMGLGGEGWLGVRNVRPFANRGYEDLDGYRLALRRNPDGTTTAIASYAGNGTDRPAEIFYEGEAPGVDPLQPDAWNLLTLMTVRDRVFFFVNGDFIAAGDGTLALGGTVSLGAVPNTTVDFDTLFMRDTTPHDDDTCVREVGFLR